MRIKDGQFFPADCILVKIENASNECFVKTVALDGERNLKSKIPCKYLNENFDAMYNPTGTVTSPPMTLETMKPIKDLYNYKGRCIFSF